MILVVTTLFFSFPMMQNVTMRRISSAKACFLSEFDEAIPKPSDLVMLLDQVILKWDSFSICYLHSHRVSIETEFRFEID